MFCVAFKYRRRLELRARLYVSVDVFSFLLIKPTQESAFGKYIFKFMENGKNNEQIFRFQCELITIYTFMNILFRCVFNINVFWNVKTWNEQFWRTELHSVQRWTIETVCSYLIIIIMIINDYYNRTLHFQ